MTPNELLEKVKGVITPMLMIDDDELLKGLLLQALMAFGKVGSVGSVRINEPDLEPFFVWDRPEDIFMVSDKDSDPMEFDLDGSYLTVDFDEGTEFPLTAMYVIDYAMMDIVNDEVPREAFQFVYQYTKALIDIDNIQRVRDAYESSQMSTEGLPLVADLRAIKEALDASIVEMSLVLPPAQVVS